MTTINLEELEVTDFFETEETWGSWLFFELREVRYYAKLVASKYNPLLYHIEDLGHAKNHCLYCKSKIPYGMTCSILEKQKEDVFRHIIKHSKNRLRWMTVTIEGKESERWKK